MSRVFAKAVFLSLCLPLVAEAARIGSEPYFAPPNEGYARGEPYFASPASGAAAAKPREAKEAPRPPVRPAAERVPAQEPAAAPEKPLPPDKNDHFIEFGPIPDIQSYLKAGKTPKFLRVNIDGYNVRKEPVFEAGRKDLIDFQTTGGSLYVITRIQPLDKGVAVGIHDDESDEERWLLVPFQRKRDFQFCESEGCFADMAGVLELLSQQSGKSEAQLMRECGLAVSPEGIVAAEAASRPAVVQDVKPTQPRPKPQVQALQARLPQAPKVQVTYGQNGCVVDTRDKPKPDFRTFRNSNALKKAFIDFMTPYALEIQDATGFPAAVVVAQAALESGWGRSSLFRNTRNIFGHSCWERGSRKTHELELFGRTKQIVGTCTTPRPSSHGGYFFSFKNSQESVYAYASNLLNSPHRYYNGLRATVKAARPGVADWRKVVEGLGRYDAPNPKYRDRVRDMVTANKLWQLGGKKLCR